MAETTDQINAHFAPASGDIPQDVLGELQSIVRVHSLSPQELFYKWESYSIKMGAENVKLDLKNARDFKKDLQEVLERESRGKHHARGAERRGGVGATPRNARATANDDMFGMMEGVVQTPRAPMATVNGNSTKRRSEFETPASKATKAHAGSSPTSAARDGTDLAKFSQRSNPGEVIQTFNPDIEPHQSRNITNAEPRIKVKANTELGKFAYKPMAMKLSVASEILDDRIDTFFEIIQQEYELSDGDFGNPANQSTSEIVAVGRIASDSTAEGRLSKNSIVLETSRRGGAGLRIPLKFDGVPSGTFFPGQIIAVRGTNPSGEAFTVSEILKMPMLPHAATPPVDIDAIHARIRSGLSEEDEPRPLNLIYSAGPYTADSNLLFEPLHALCDRAAETAADALVLTGPFLDTEHPLIATGQLPSLPASLKVDPDTATMVDAFRGYISLPLQRLAQSLPHITIIMIPSVRDAVNKHASWPQDRMVRKELGLPKQSVVVTNPVTLSLNECVVGVCSQDALYELKREECNIGSLPAESQDTFARLSRHLLEQRHFFPLFPPLSKESSMKPTPLPGVVNTEQPTPTGAMLDTSYIALGEMHSVRPDVLITPSTLGPFVKVVDSVLVINPGQLSKKKASGTFAHMYLKAPKKPSSEDREKQVALVNEVWERARVDVVRI